MSAKLIPSDPDKVMVIRNVTPDVITCSVPFLRFGRIKIGGRGTIVRMSNGDLAVFSPVALTPEVKSRLSTFGTVKYITALDLEHHIFLGDWHKEFPSAKLIGPSDLPAKREKSNMAVPFSYLFGPKTPPKNGIDPAFDAEFDYEFVAPHPNKEIVFCHKPSKTLIEADFMFNLPATEQYSKSGLDPTTGVLSQLFNAVNSARGSAIWQKRLLWYAMSSSDRPAFNASVKKIDSWDFNKIIPCHGDVVENDAKGVFRKVFEWHLQGTAKKD